MLTYRCKRCTSVWTDNNTPSPCPNCGLHEDIALSLSEKTYRLRLMRSERKWALEFEGVESKKSHLWREKPPYAEVMDVFEKSILEWLEE